MKVAVITAGPDAAFREHREAVKIIAAAGARAVYIAVNDIGMTHPDPLHHWASVHIDQMVHPDFRWEARRKENGLRCDYLRWSLTAGGQVDRVANTKGFRGGSSGLHAVDVGLNGVGCDGAILCGVRLDASPNPLNRKSRDGWGAFQRFRLSWDKLPDPYRKKITSMSGWTREQFGVPTLGWIASLEGVSC